jgi:hypothetical protein
VGRPHLRDGDGRLACGLSRGCCHQPIRTLRGMCDGCSARNLRHESAFVAGFVVTVWCEKSKPQVRSRAAR